MGCSSHLTTHRDCQACQIAAVGANVNRLNKEQAARNAAAQQANAVAQGALEYQRAAHAAARDAAWEAERQADNTASYERAMWLQSPAGKQWERWSGTARQWIAVIVERDELTKRAWRAAATPGWDEDAENRADDLAERRTRRIYIAAIAAPVIVVLSVVLFNPLFGTFLPKVVKDAVMFVIFWGALIATLILAVVAAIAWLSDNRRTLAWGRKIKLAEASGYRQDAKQNPFVDAGNLPSWRAGFTFDESDKDVDDFRAVAYPREGFFPSVDHLYDLPALTVRSADGLPQPVADTLREMLSR